MSAPWAGVRAPSSLGVGGERGSLGPPASIIITLKFLGLRREPQKNSPGAGSAKTPQPEEEAAGVFPIRWIATNETRGWLQVVTLAGITTVGVYLLAG